MGWKESDVKEAATVAPGGVVVLDGHGRPHRRMVTARQGGLDGRLAFHGILPASLREACIGAKTKAGLAVAGQANPGQAGTEHDKAGPVSGASWPMLAPALESVCNGWRERRPRVAELAEALLTDTRRLSPDDSAQPTIEETTRLAGAVLDTGVRGFDQGVEALLAWLTPPRLCAIAATVVGRPWTMRSRDRLVVRMVKEGHMSSVAVVTLLRPGGRHVRFVVNISRDASVACAEQRLLAARLTRMGGDGAVKVLAEGVQSIRWFGRSLGLHLLAVTHAEGHELHPLPGHDPGDPPRLLAVDGFHDDPGHDVPGVRGRVLPGPVADEVWARVVGFMTRHAELDRDEITAPSIELADGDAVVDLRSDPPGVVIVATDRDDWRSPLAWWPYHAVLVSARDDHSGAGRLCWNRPELALTAMTAGFVDALGPSEAGVVLHQMLRRAVELADGDLTRIAAAHDLDSLEPLAGVRSTLSRSYRPSAL